MPPDFSVNRLLSQYVPLHAPEGSYTMNGYAGDYDLNDVWAEDHFNFMKICNGGEAVPYLPGVEGFDLSFPQDTFSIVLDQIKMQAHPNPFNPTTNISFQLPAASWVKLEVFDIVGRKVTVSGSGAPKGQATPTTALVEGWRDAGVHEVTFDGSDLTSGVYIYRLIAGKFTASGKIVLMK